jgi:NADH:ubiquinone oxidoreductase subunit 3 (subunit A)
MNDKDLLDYMYIGLFFLGGIVAACAPIIISQLVQPRTKISERTLQTYECGNIPYGQSWDFRHGIGFYVYALMFLAFEVDVLYLFPVATVFHKVPALRAIGLFVVFIGILALGLVYAWRKGAFLWTSEKKIY